MKRRFLATVVGFVSAALLCIAPAADARIVTIGEQDFDDGMILSSASAYNDAQEEEEGPFSFLGSDPSNSSFSAEWGFSFGAGEMSSAMLSFGMYDGDAQAEGSQVGSFTVDGVDLTDMMDDVFESKGGAQKQYSVYSIRLPADVLVQLTDGAASFALTLSGPGLGIFGNTDGNGAGLDFSSLEVLPEPSAVLLTLLGFFALAAARPSRRC